MNTRPREEDRGGQAVPTSSARAETPGAVPVRERIRAALAGTRTLVGVLGLIALLVGGIGAEVIAWRYGYPKPPFNAVFRPEYQPWSIIAAAGLVLAVAGFGLRLFVGVTGGRGGEA